MEYLLMKRGIIYWRGGRGSLRECYKSYGSKRLTPDTTSKGIKDKLGNWHLDMCLKKIIACCHDSEEQETML
jgi:hypothetical protein